MSFTPAMAMAPIDLSLASGRVTSTTAVESLYAAWLIGSTYALTNRVTSNHRDYESLQAGNVGHDPATSPTWWQDLGPSNKYAMFDADRNTATTGASPLTVEITPGQRIGGLSLFGVTADRIDVTMTSAGVPVYTKGLSLLARNTRSWFEYFFGAFTYRESMVFFDLPPITNGVLTVTLTRATGNASCESFSVGMPIAFGGVKLGAQTDLLDFSRVERDAFGNATLVRRKNVPTCSMQVLLDKASVSKIRKFRETNAARPIVIAGITNSEDGYFDSLAVMGIFKRMPIVIEYSLYSLCNVEMEGL